MPARFFQPSYSQQVVPSYAPLPLDSIQYGVEAAGEARELADTTLDAFTETQQDQLSGLVPANRRQAAEILDADTEFIDRLSDPESDVRYQDMPGLLRRQARKSQQKLQPYLQDSARIQQFQEDKEEMYAKGDMSLPMRNYYDRVLSDYEGLQTDEDGREIGFKPPPLVRKVDVNERLDNFMKHLQDGNEQVLVDEYGADPRFVREIATRYRSGEDIAYVREALTSLLRSEPETEQYLQAEHLAEQDLRQRRGEEPIEYGEFINNIVTPYVAADAQMNTKQSLRSNPGFSIEDAKYQPITGSLAIGSPESNISTPGSFLQAVGEMKEVYGGVQEQVGNDLNQMGLDYNFDEETGRVVVSNPVVDGVDHSSRIQRFNEQLTRSFENVQNLQAYDEEIREQAGIEDWGESEELYEDELRAAYKKWNRAQGMLEMGRADHAFIQGKDAWAEFQQSPEYKRALQNASPEFKKYTELLHENAKGGHREVRVTSLGRRADQSLEEYLVKFNPVIEDGKTRQPIQDDDKDFDVRTAQLAGVFAEPGGKLKVAYQVWDDEDPTDPRLILTDAPPEARHHLFQAGQYTQFDAITYDRLGRLSEEPGGQTTTTLPITDSEGEAVPGADLQVRILRRSQQNQPGGGKVQYEVMVPRADGVRTPHQVGSLAQVADIYRKFYAKVNE